MTNLAVLEATNVNALTPERQRLLEALTKDSYNTVTDLCAAANVTRNVYYDALSSKEFVDALFRDSNALIYSAIPQVVQKIIKQAKAGSFVHQKMLLEMVKLYQANGDGGTVNNFVFVGVRGVSEIPNG